MNYAQMNLLVWLSFLNLTISLSFLLLTFTFFKIRHANFIVYSLDQFTSTVQFSSTNTQPLATFDSIIFYIIPLIYFTNFFFPIIIKNNFLNNQNKIIKVRPQCPPPTWNPWNGWSGLCRHTNTPKLALNTLLSWHKSPPKLDLLFSSSASTEESTDSPD